MSMEEAKRRAAEMKAAAAAKKAAKAAATAGGAAAPPTEAVDELFLAGEHNLVLIDWDDTLFPTSAWKDRIKEGAAHPPRPSKVAALSESIGTFIRTLQQSADVKIVTHGTRSWFDHSSSVLSSDTQKLLNSLPHRYRDSTVNGGHGEKYMKKLPHGQKYTTDIGVQVDNCTRSSPARSRGLGSLTSGLPGLALRRLLAVPTLLISPT